MRRRMEAGLRYSQPPQAVAAFQELSTEHLSRSAWTIRNQKLFDRHLRDQESEFPRHPLQATDRHDDELLGEDNRGDELPEGLRSQEGRLDRLKDCKARLESEDVREK